jgi:serine/threonine protein phosphatase PrpC
VSDSAVQGARWTMEDAYTVANGGHFVAVYDGHGGADVSGMLRDRVHTLYREALPRRHLEETQKTGNYASYNPSVQSHIAAIRAALNRVERDVLKVDDLEYQGSTAVVVLVHQDDDGERTLVSANIGDSRAILSREGKAVDLTKDHKPCDEREKARIRSMGADIQWDPYGQLYRVNDLSLSRAIGDRFAKPVVSSEAEIDCFPIIDGKDEFFVSGTKHCPMTHSARISSLTISRQFAGVGVRWTLGCDDKSRGKFPSTKRSTCLAKRSPYNRSF